MSQKICKKKGLHEKSISLNNEKKSKIFKQLIRSLDKDLIPLLSTYNIFNMFHTCAKNYIYTLLKGPSKDTEVLPSLLIWPDSSNTHAQDLLDYLHNKESIKLHGINTGKGSKAIF